MGPARLRLATVTLAFASGLGALIAPASASGAVARATSGPVTAELAYTRDAESTPVTLQVTRGAVSATFGGLEGGDDPDDGPWSAQEFRGPLIVRDMDGDDEPEVIVRLYSGGAHCCERSAIAALSSDGAYRLSIRDWADASWRLEDLDGDGIVELVSWDARWAYWGSSYAESPSPLQIWSFRAGALVDTSAEHPVDVLADMAEQWRIYRLRAADGLSGRGNLAAYVAGAYITGRQEAAWRRIYRSYQEPGRVRFFRALTRRLTDLGYRFAGRQIPAIPRSRRPGRWRACTNPVPEVGFIERLQARGIGCRLARRIALESTSGASGAAPTSSRFRCRPRVVAIETLRLRCIRGVSEQVRFSSGV